MGYIWGDKENGNGEGDGIIVLLVVLSGRESGGGDDDEKKGGGGCGDGDGCPMTQK